MKNQILDIFDARASVRSFLPRQVEAEKIRSLCACAVKAPTACNMQQWRFTIVTDSILKQRIVDAGGSRLIASAPIGILVSYAKDTKNILYRDNIQSAAAAIENILLAAPQLGLGACWICNLPAKNFLRRLFHIHRRFEPIAYILLGYPAKTVKPMPLKHALNEIIAENTFPQIPEDKNYSAFKTLCLRCIVLGYRFSPSIVKKIFLNNFIDAKFTKKFEKE